MAVLSTHDRPWGVTIIAILNVIGGIMTLIAGIATITGGVLLPTVSQETLQQGVPGMGTSALSNISTTELGIGAVVLGAILIGLAVFSFVVGWGLLKGRGWARGATIALSIINIVLGAVSLAAGNVFAILSIIISGVIIYYMYRPSVKAFFGKEIGRRPTVGDSAAA
jgi:hypothetical protein